MKKRYSGYICGNCVDNENNLDIVNCLDRLNEQDKYIKQLEKENGYFIYSDGYDKDGKFVANQEYVKYCNKFVELLNENIKLRKFILRLGYKISDILENEK